MDTLEGLRTLLDAAATSTSDELIDRLDALAGDLAKEGAAPTPSAPQIFGSAAALLHRVAEAHPSEACLRACLAAAEYFYLSSQGRRAIEPVEDAVLCARAVGDNALIRRALNFQGIVLADTGNFAGAIEAYAEAMEHGQRLSDRLPEAIVWNNLGHALIMTAAYGDAIACLERAIALTDGDDRPAVRQNVLAARANIALASLHLDDFGAGLRNADAAVEALKTPNTPQQLMQRATAETIYARLLIEARAFSTAKERVAIAKQFAARSRFERAELEASIAEGLVEVHNGQTDVGLSRLARVLERARTQRGSLRDALIAIVKAHEVAGKHDVALVYLRELMMHTGDARKESALLHHRLHLDRLDRRRASEPTTTVDRVMEHRESALRHKLAKQVAKQEMVRARIEMLERLAITAELRDDASGEHCFRVGRLAALLAQEYGCEEETCAMIDLAARLHDIGKVGVPDGILLKRGKLNDAEVQIVRAHANIGAELLAQSHEEHLKLAEDIARFHHEWWNGGGYPFGIGETAIPLAARITALADVFDTLTHERVYRPAMPVQAALDEILKLKGQQFEPDLTDRFLALIPRLQRDVGDLDAHLGLAASESTFIRARRKIADTLRRAQGRGDGQHASPPKPQP